MSLKHAILGFLEMAPSSGYDLKKVFDATVNFFWSATHTQIYRTLEQMQQEGLVAVETIQQESRPNKKVYSLTESGKSELVNWLKTPLELPTLRHKLLVQLTWADLLKSNQIIGLLEEYASKVERVLDLYKTQNRRIIQEHARSDREGFLWHLTLENGIAVYQAELEWARQAIDEIQNRFPDI